MVYKTCSILNAMEITLSIDRKKSKTDNVQNLDLEKVNFNVSIHKKAKTRRNSSNFMLNEGQYLKNKVNKHTIQDTGGHRYRSEVELLNL